MPQVPCEETLVRYPQASVLHGTYTLRDVKCAPDYLAVPRAPAQGATFLPLHPCPPCSPPQGPWEDYAMDGSVGMSELEVGRGTGRCVSRRTRRCSPVRASCQSGRRARHPQRTEATEFEMLPRPSPPFLFLTVQGTSAG